LKNQKTNILFTTEHRKDQMWEIRQFLGFHERYEFIFNSMAVIRLKKLGQGQQKAGRVNGTREKWLEKQVATNQVNRQKISDLLIWKGSINAERYKQVVEQHLLPSRRRLLQGRPCIFQQDKVKPHPASIPTAWLRSRRVLDWPACSPDLLPSENFHNTTKKCQDCWAARILYHRHVAAIKFKIQYFTWNCKISLSTKTLWTFDLFSMVSYK